MKYDVEVAGEVATLISSVWDPKEETNPSLFAMQAGHQQVGEEKRLFGESEELGGEGDGNRFSEVCWCHL